MGAKRDELTNMLKMCFEQQKNYLATLTAGERSAIGKVDDWSPKDVIAHIAHWDSVMVAHLAHPESGRQEEAAEDESFDVVNARVWKKYQNANWQEIGELIDKNRKEMLSDLQSMTEEQLADPDLYEWTHGRTLWRYIILSSYYHSLQHIADLYAKRGDLALANQMQEDAAIQQLALSDAEDWHGTVLYNLGCHYAITGQNEKALENVRQGIELYPYLKEWAPKDQDLVSLHDDPEFKAMLE